MALTPAEKQKRYRERQAEKTGRTPFNAMLTDEEKKVVREFIKKFRADS